jgi:hypothetical protein
VFEIGPAKAETAVGQPLGQDAGAGQGTNTQLKW